MMEYHEGSNNFLLRRRTNEWLEVIDELFLTRLFLTYSYLPVAHDRYNRHEISIRM